VTAFVDIASQVECRTRRSTRHPRYERVPSAIFSHVQLID